VNKILNKSRETNKDKKMCRIGAVLKIFSNGNADGISDSHPFNCGAVLKIFLNENAELEG